MQEVDYYKDARAALVLQATGLRSEISAVGKSFAMPGCTWDDDAKERHLNGLKEKLQQFEFAISRLPQFQDTEAPADEKPIRDLPEWQQESEGDRRMRRTVRGRRFLACRAAGNMRAVIEALPSDFMRGDLINMSNLLLRMVLRENDGQVSPSTLNAF